MCNHCQDQKAKDGQATSSRNVSAARTPAMDGRTNFKVGEKFEREGRSMCYISRSVGETRSTNTADIQLIQCRNQQKTSSNRQHIVLY